VTALDALGILAAGGAAGAINVAVGSGTLITFPIVLAFGYPPVVANVSNTIGLVPGSVAGAIGYRRELADQLPVVGRLACATAVGAASGAVLLLTLPPSAFRSIVPGCIVLALVLILAQPRLASLLRARRAHHAVHLGVVTMGAVFAVGVYGGYFGAAQGILLLAILGLALDDELQRVNAVKNVLAGLANLLSGLIFALAAHVAWDVVGLIAAGSLAGGTLAARYGRRLSPRLLRALIVAVGIIAVVRLL